MEVSPLLADDTRSTIEAARSIHKLADRPNLYVKIPGTPAGVPAIEEAIFAGVPVNVTLLFSREQYLAVAEAYMRGLERRVAAKLDVRASSSVASLFVSRWDKAVADKVPAELRNRLGIAIAARTYKAHCDLVKTERWRALAAAGARVQRMLWASTGTKDPKASPTLYVEALAAPNTVDTMPEKTLAALAESKGDVAAASAHRGRRRCGTGPRALRQGRRRRRRACEKASAGRRGVLRQVLERAHAEHRGQERGARHHVSARS